MTAVVLRGDARRLPLPDASADLIVTSPPYFGLRSYTDGGGHYDGQIGSEASPGEWVAALVACTAEWVRVLKPSGSIFVNLGDSYAAYNNNRGPSRSFSAAADRGRNQVSQPGLPGGTRAKSLMGLPWRYALACMDELGLILRRDIIWSKPNGLPESVTDRCRSSHEYLFHFTVRPRYYAAVDEIREPHIYPADRRFERNTPRDKTPGAAYTINSPLNPLGKLPGSVWEIHAGEPTVRLILRAVADGALTIDEAERLMKGILWTGSTDSTPTLSGQTAAGTGSDVLTMKATDSTGAQETASGGFTGSPMNSGSGPSQTGSPSTTAATPTSARGRERTAFIEGASIPPTSSLSPSPRTSGEDVRPPSPPASTGTTSPPITPMSEPTDTASAGPACENEHELTGDVWSIPSQPLIVPPSLGIDHFASFPMELPRRVILGWSPPGICTECGEGRRPVASSVALDMTRPQARRAQALADQAGLTEAHLQALLSVGVSDTGRGAATQNGTGKNTPEVYALARAARTVLGGYAREYLLRRPTGFSYVCACTPFHWREDDSARWKVYHFDRWTPPPTRPAVVVDPFGGTGTTALVASMLGRLGVSVDLSADYCRLARWRTTDPAERARALQVPKPPPVPDGQASLFDEAS